MQDDNQDIRNLLQNWRIDLHRLRPDVDIAGSPERTEFRTVLEDTGDRLWLLERIPTVRHRQKRDIHQLLVLLRDRGMEQVQPYCPDTTGETLVSHQGTYWQLIAFISGFTLERPAYVLDQWRGPALADFLVEFASHTGDFEPIHAGPEAFSLPSYITRMGQIVGRHNPELSGPLAPILAFLADGLFPVYDELPIRLCHGDYHPLNIIWGEDGIRSVIDWEFHGPKPEAYDVANMVGCLGMEDPAALEGPLVTAFLNHLGSAGFMADISYEYLLDLALAIRFGWMAEWLRKSDTEMIRLELTYMYLLMDNRKKITAGWE